MPKKQAKEYINIYEVKITKTKQRYVITFPKDMGKYVMEHNGTLKGSYTVQDGQISFLINNLKLALPDKIKELEKELG